MRAILALGSVILLSGAAWAATPQMSILVDKSDNKLVLRGEGKVLRTYTVATGKDNSTPVGTFKIINKIENPTWYKPGGGVYPAGDKRNEIGTRWMGISKKGYGIHGTIEPDKMGRQVSAGCIRMKNEEVEELFNLVPAGTPITIRD